MKRLEDASQSLIDNLIFAIDHSMDLKKHGVDPMMPFAVVIKGANRTLKTFAGDIDYADKLFVRTIEQENPDIVVYASDTYFTMEGIKYDAVLFKAYDNTDADMYIVVQRYIPQTEEINFEQIGNPAFLETVANNFNIQHKPGKKPWWKWW